MTVPTEQDYNQAMVLIDKYLNSESMTLEGVILQLLTLLALEYQKQNVKQ